ncbi:MAG TPA: aspartate ammonia-lyase [Acholeplasmatales bacterium]|nr:aspartate ammonia-lyase [Acholeplasmatales bacterium]
MRYRIETDSLGEKQIPAEAYYGIGALRSKETFEITKHGLLRQMIKAFAEIKKAAAKTNLDLGLLDKQIANVISLSCDEIINGRLHGQFITDVLQGGAGISMDKNANEVIANRANEMLGGEKGSYNLVDPNLHVNLNQSSRENVLIAGKLAGIRLTKKLLLEAKKLSNAYENKLAEYALNKDEPLSIGQELSAFNEVLERDIKRTDAACDELTLINSNYYSAAGIEANPLYAKKFVKYVSAYASQDLSLAKNTVENRRNLDAFTWLSSALKNMIMNLSKVATDLEILERQGKVKLPKVETGDSPVVLEMIKQVSFYIMGNDLTVTRAIEAGELEENFFLPVIYACLFESLNLIRRAIRTLREKTIEPLTI